MIDDVNDIRRTFKDLYRQKKFVTLGNGVKTIEIAPAFFIADESSIFGEPNYDYIDREIEWYKSMSRNVNDIPGGPPAIWKRVATLDGRINSNYGWCIFSEENGSQFQNVADELRRDPASRRAVMIYTRPSMHVDQNTDGMQDFMCTNTVQYFIRDGVLSCLVSMRSNDAYHGYRNDWAWQEYVLELLADVLGINEGDIWWSAGSLHFYETHFHLLED